MYRCQFEIPVGWRQSPQPSEPTAQPAPTTQTVLEPATAQDPRTCGFLVVLQPALPAGDLVSQLLAGVTSDLAANAQAFGLTEQKRTNPQTLRLAHGPAVFQTVWTQIGPSRPLLSPESAASWWLPKSTQTVPSQGYGQGRMYLLLDCGERRIPVLFVGGPDALPLHQPAIDHLLSTLRLDRLSNTDSGTPHAAWSD